MKSQLRRRASFVALAAMLALAASGAASAATIEGRVTDASDTAVLQGAVVSIQELGVSTTTGRDGIYRFRDIPAGSYTLTVDYVGGARTSAAITVAAADAASQDFQIAGSGAERVVVLGQRGSLFNALNQKRASDVLSEVLSADAIGQFPDQNVSEAVRRVAGVSVANDQGEGRFVIIRGLDPNLNATSVNGVRIPAPEGDERAVALDVIDSDVLSGITITKSTTPDMDGDAIGGTVNIETLSAFDREDRFFSGQVGGSYNELTERVGPRVSVTGSDLFANGRLGVAGSLSWRERTFATENQEVDGDWENEDGVLWQEELELRDYVVTRERANATLNFDYRPNDDHDFFLRTLWSDFRDQEFRNRVEVKYDDACYREDLSAPGAPVFQSGEVDCDGDPDEYAFEVDRDLKDREETQQIYTAAIGGQSRFNAWTLDYSAAFSHSEEEEPDAIDTVDFRAEYEDPGFFGQDTTNPLRPLLGRGVAGAIDIDDPSLFEMDGVEYVHGLTEDEEVAAQFDLRRDFVIDAMPTYFQLGGKLRNRDKSRDVNTEIFEPVDLTLSDFLGGSSYPLDTFGPAVRGDFRDYFLANQADFELNAFDTAIAQNVEDYDAEEDIQAAYVMAGIDAGPLSAVVGVRYEGTDFTATAVQVAEVELDDADADDPLLGFPDGVILAQDDGDVVVASPAAVDQSYEDWLPSVTLRYDLTESFLLRGAYYGAVSRPKFSAVVPAAEIEAEIEGDDAEYQGSFGNPDLRRQTAENVDVAAEWYLGNNGLLSVGAFYKDFDDFIAPTFATDVEIFGLMFSEAEVSANLDEASLSGIELNYQQALTMLPEPFDGIILGANYTLLDGEATAPDGRTIPLPRLSESVANLVLGYDRGPFDVRLALSHRDDYLDEIGLDGAPDRYADARTQLDISGRFRVTDQIRLYAEVNNITDEPESYYYLLEGGTQALSQYERYGYTANFGIKYQY